jgi:hypothetical protein
MNQDGLSHERPESKEQDDDGLGRGSDRREMFKKMGRYAAYTAPAMLALLLPEKAAGGFLPTPQ